MIKLHVFGADLGLADPSPFVTKAIMLLKLAGLAYTMQRADVRKAPKEKLPVIEDDGQIVPDSTFIRFHIENKYGFDYDKNLNAEQKAICWAFEKMCDDHLYWIVVYERWIDDTNFQNGPARFFNSLPAPMRPFIKFIVRKQIRKSLHAHGMGRHTPAEMALLGNRAIGAIATVLDDKTYFMGGEPCGADATIYSFLAAGACPVFRSSVRGAIEKHPNLMAYIEHMTQRYFPELVQPDRCLLTRST